MSNSGVVNSAPTSRFGSSTSVPSFQEGNEKKTSRWKWASQIRQRIAHRALCDKCRTMLREAGNGKLREGEDSEMKTVFRSTELPENYLDGNCALCKLLLNSLSGEQKDRMREHKLAGPHLETSEGSAQEFEIEYYVYHDLSSRIIGLYHSISASEYMINDLHFIGSREFGRCFNWSSKRNSTASQASLSTAKHWLGICAKQHETCSSNMSSNNNLANQSFLPSRLIQVSTGSPLCARLVERVQIAPNAKYLTLSHCWGQHIPKTLLTDNMIILKQGIVVKELSKTFQHALVLTRYLGLSYIWIDALCIVQDSEEDWQKESAQMDQIYSGTYCNISATAASDGSVGLFFERDIRIFQPLKVRVGDASHYIVDGNIWQHNIEDAPLNQRAWVCQERMLSPKNLHFTSTQIFWECREHSGCETFPMAFPSCITGTTTKRVTPQDGSAIRIQADLPADPALDAYTVWGSIVTAYSKGDLTQEKDKLIAIGGMAAQLQPILDDKYLAGMWERHLASTLTWAVDQAAKNTRPKRYIAPSWSWASVNGQIRRLGDILYADGREVLIDILAAHVDYETSNIFGQLRGGSLRLRGNLAKMAVNPSSIFPTIFAESPVKENISVHPDINYSESQWLAPHHSNLYCLPTKDWRVKSSDGFLDGLLLEPTANLGEFRRWGRFTAVTTSSIEAIREGCQFFDSKADESGLEYCDDGRGGYKYTLTII